MGATWPVNIEGSIVFVLCNKVVMQFWTVPSLVLNIFGVCFYRENIWCIMWFARREVQYCQHQGHYGTWVYKVINIWILTTYIGIRYTELKMSLHIHLEDGSTVDVGDSKIPSSITCVHHARRWHPILLVNSIRCSENSSLPWKNKWLFNSSLREQEGGTICERFWHSSQW